MLIPSHTILHPLVMEQILTLTTRIPVNHPWKCPMLETTPQDLEQVDTHHMEVEMVDTALLPLSVQVQLVSVQQATALIGDIKLKATPIIHITRLLTVDIMDKLHHP